MTWDEASPMSAGEVRLWFSAIDQIPDQAVARARDVLSATERQRCDRFRRDEDRRAYAVTHALLRRILTRHEGLPPSEVTFGVGPHGKPFLSGRETLHFNIAHTRGLGACVLSKAGPVGVDVEWLGRAVNAQELAGVHFSERETASLLESSADERQIRFYEHWTLKEAFVKALGTGLTHPLREVVFELRGSTGLQLHAPPDMASCGDWKFALLAPSARHRLAVAVHSRDPRPAFRVGSWPTSTPMPEGIVMRMSNTTGCPLI